MMGKELFHLQLNHQMRVVSVHVTKRPFIEMPHDWNTSRLSSYHDGISPLEVSGSYTFELETYEIGVQNGRLVFASQARIPHEFSTDIQLIEDLPDVLQLTGVPLSLVIESNGFSSALSDDLQIITNQSNIIPIAQPNKRDDKQLFMQWLFRHVPQYGDIDNTSDYATAINNVLDYVMRQAIGGDSTEQQVANQIIRDFLWAEFPSVDTSKFTPDVFLNNSAQIANVDNQIAQLRAELKNAEVEQVESIQRQIESLNAQRAWLISVQDIETVLTDMANDMRESIPELVADIAASKALEDAIKDDLTTTQDNLLQVESDGDLARGDIKGRDAELPEMVSNPEYLNALRTERKSIVEEKLHIAQDYFNNQNVDDAQVYAEQAQTLIANEIPNNVYSPLWLVESALPLFDAAQQILVDIAQYAVDEVQGRLDAQMAHTAALENRLEAIHDEIARLEDIDNFFSRVQSDLHRVVGILHSLVNLAFRRIGYYPLYQVGYSDDAIPENFGFPFHLSKDYTDDEILVTDVTVVSGEILAMQLYTVTVNQD